MLAKKAVTLLSLLVLLMLVSGEEELIRVKRLHNEETALSSEPIIHHPPGEEIQGQPDREHPVLVPLPSDDDPFTKASLDTKGVPSATRNPSKPSSLDTVGGMMKRRIKRMVEDASLLKRSITHLLGSRDEAVVIDGERLKREKRPVNRRRRRTR